jgi:hypothetical protein
VNLSNQYYKGICLRLIKRNYDGYKARRYLLIPYGKDRHQGKNPSQLSDIQNVWIPNKHLEEDGTIRPSQDLDYVFRKSQRQLELAGYTGAIPGIKRESEA